MGRILHGLISLLLVLVVSGCAALAGDDEGDGGGGTANGGGKVAVAKPTPKPTKPPLRVADLLGSDGRLTVLILGSDEREGVIGARTDAIIVATPIFFYTVPAQLKAIPHYGEIPFYKNQVRVAMRNIGRIDPTDLMDAIAHGAYAGLAKAMLEMTPDQVLDDSGHGNAAFQLHHVRCACAHQLRRGFQRLPYARIAHERHIDDTQRALPAPRDTGGVIDHVLYGNRQGRFVPLNHHTQGIPHQ